MPLQVRSKVDPDGSVEISLVDVPTPAPKEDEVVVRVDAAPLNPSDLNVLLGRADLATLQGSATAVKGRVIEGAVAHLGARLGKPLPVGNEGAGLVIATGNAPAAQALLGKIVGIYGGATYAEERCVAAAQCLLLPEGTSAAEGASNFVNPMTALAMLETMRREGHTAIVHTAAASNLGRMMIKLCSKDGVPLVNVVRKPEHVAALRALGAVHVCDSSAASFDEDLRAAIVATKATLAFDAIGGGELASRILTAMELAANAGAERYSPYGSTTHKQLYLYGALDRGPTMLTRNYGMSWSIGGWLVSNALAKSPPEIYPRLRARVASELKTTFASEYTAELSLRELIDPTIMRRYARQATGEKFLLVPSKR